MNYWLIMLIFPIWSAGVISASVESNTLENTTQITLDVTTEASRESEPPKEVKKKRYHFVKFYAPWCVHSVRLEPIWNKIAESPEFHGKVSLVRIDCDHHESLCKDFDIKGYPTLIWLEDYGRKAVRKYTGTNTHGDIISFLREMINEKAITE